jgi:hypothetical protein
MGIAGTHQKTPPGGPGGALRAANEVKQEDIEV